MSDSQEHELPFKTPKQLIAAIVAAFLVPIFIIVLLANYVTTGNKPAAGSNAMTAESVAERIKPVAQLSLVDANAPKVLKTGEEVYKGVCTGCHATGAAGAPMFGDKGQWGPRIAKGFDTLWKHAVNGYNAMPAKGGNPDLDDVEVARAVVYMTNDAGANFKAPEPAAPAAPSAEAPAADATAAASAPAAAK